MPYDNTNFAFSISGMKKLFGKVTNKRVSEDSARELGQELDDFASEVSKEAIEVASDDGRKTVRSGDIRQAVKNLDR